MSISLAALVAEKTTKDGPFTETKEHLGGFDLVECADVDEALDWASRVPLSPGLVVEVRRAVS